MPTADTELRVPFQEKDMAKALGARWNPQKRIWFVPAGLDLKPFGQWLGDTQLDSLVVSQSIDHVEHDTGQSLISYLAHITQAVASVGRTAQWVKAEISHLPPAKRGHYYLELMEQNELGHLTAKAPAIIWHSQAINLMPKFESATGSPLQANMKVLLLVTAKFDPLYGFKLNIEDIDPAYTLGDMAEKLAKIREALKEEQLFDANRTFDLPSDFTRIAVISPSHAAGLGDFQREASILQDHALCVFNYFHAQFQGKDAPQQIADAIQLVLNKHMNNPYDGIIIIRGGGAVTDLAWLNDYKLAKILCQLPLPLLTGIGHQKDRTILDEIACHSFDTPSKVSAYIFTSICTHAQQAIENWRQLNHLTQQNMLTAENNIINQNKLLHQLAKSHWQQAMQSTTISFTQTTNQAQHHWYHCSQKSLVLKNNIYQFMQDALRRCEIKLSVYDIKNLQQDLRHMVQAATKSLLSTWEFIGYHTKKLIQQQQVATTHLIKQIIGLGPQATLERGFAIIKDQQGATLSSVEQAKNSVLLNLTFKDGTMEARPTSKDI